MKEADRIEILKSQCIEYAKYYGCLEVKHISGSPFYTCELNGVLTAIYPVAIKGNMYYESESKMSPRVKNLNLLYLTIRIRTK